MRFHQGRPRAAAKEPTVPYLTSAPRAGGFAGGMWNHRSYPSNGRWLGTSFAALPLVSNRLN